MSLIKKNQIRYGKETSCNSILKSTSQKFQLNLSIPKDKIEEEIKLLKQELMKESESCLLQLENEKILIKNKEKELEQKLTELDNEKKLLFSDIAAAKEKAIKEASDKGYSDGKKKGYDDGIVKGDAEGRIDHDKARKAYEEALYDLIDKFKELDEYKKEILVNTEPYLISLLDVIVKKLLSRSIDIDKNIMIEVVREALLPVTSGHGLTIKVNPENVQHLEDNKTKLLSEFMSIKECTIVGDSDVSQGGCLIEANFGVIDSRIESKMQSIKDLIQSIQGADIQKKSENIVPDILAVKSDTLASDNDLFGNGDDLLSLDDDLDINSFDFLTDDDE
ncbi:MAG: FliH/SctL family protein [Candidatus Margulisbacteria bacterium]|nr:FliH/SctL family protein [Candidatus Margulisiibacteriota bacterium]